MAIQCPACGGSTSLGKDNRPRCDTCEWGREGFAAEDVIAFAPDDIAESSRPEPTVPRLKKKRKRKLEDDAEEEKDFPSRRGNTIPFFVVFCVIAVVWSGLWFWATQTFEAGYWLACTGGITAMVGLVWLYSSASMDGVERMTLFGSDFFSGHSRIMLFLLVFRLLVELIVLPIFCTIYLLTHFESAWKPFSIFAVGLGMIAHGVYLAT